MSRKAKKAVGDRFKQLMAVADASAGWSPPREVLTTVRAVPTIFPQLDVATRVGGWPLQRLELLHGPASEGKSKLLHGLGWSFLLAGGLYRLVDAEFTTDDRWLEGLLGKAAVDHPGFRAKRPNNYDETIDAVQSVLEVVIGMRERGDLDPETPLLLGVDSLVKLVPADLLKKVREDIAKHGRDGAGGRGAMIQAAWNSSWFKSLTPLLYQANASMTVITREGANTDKRGPYDPDFVLRGGRDVGFESSLTARVKRSWVRKGEDVVGERHQVAISKTKVGGKDDRTIVCHYHGTLAKGGRPSGFDRTRDVVELAFEHGALQRHGKSAVADASTGEEWRSENACLDYLNGHLDEREDLEQRARAAGAAAVADGAHASAPDPEEKDLAKEMFGE